MAKQDFEELILRGVESDELDYKAHQSWNTMTRVARAKIVRHLTAFANTNGGYLVVGVGEDASGYPGVLQGLSDEESSSFDPSKVGAFVNSCIEPPIDFTIERPLVRGKRFAVFVVKPFTTIPHVCRRGVENELREGVFYIRTVDASSRPATRAIEMHSLIQRALRNQREMLGRMLRGILYETNSGNSTEQPGVIEQLKYAQDYFIHRRKPEEAESYAFIQLTVIPDGAKELQVTSFEELLIDPASFPGCGRFIVRKELADVRETSTGWRMLSASEPRMWQIFKNGAFIFTAYLPLAEKTLPAAELTDLVRECIDFSASVYVASSQEERLCSVRIAVHGEQEFSVSFDGVKRLKCDASGATAEICRSAADLISAPEVHAGRIIKKFSAGLED